MSNDRIKEILKKIDSGGQDAFLPEINKPKPEPVLHSQKAEAPMKVTKWRIYLAALVAFLILLAAGYGLTLVYKNFKILRSDDPSTVIEALGRLTDLPMAENPTVSTVTDLEAIKSQPFFRDAEIGDKVVVYNNAKKAYLYRPSTQKIIGIAPLSSK